MTALAITIDGQPFEHLLYPFVLTYSNAETCTLDTRPTRRVGRPARAAKPRRASRAPRRASRASATGCRTRCGSWAESRPSTSEISNLESEISKAVCNVP